jgi:hypothetical protein
LTQLPQQPHVGDLNTSTSGAAGFGCAAAAPISPRPETIKAMTVNRDITPPI